ncbi:glycerophosphodiester phosphodiesterase [Nakamurella alba]|nr:glycerophosphodiester phosphodiesterase family protein [Nakamurella alba]
MESLLQRGGLPLVIAHRGASAAAPENTLAAFELARTSGAHWLETDVQPTADDVPVLLHDDDVDRTTDGSGAVRELPAHDVAVLDAGSWFSGDFAGERVPELQQLLAAPAMTDDGRRLLLELKGAHTARQVGAVIEVLRASGLDDRVLLQSFEVDVLRIVRELLPGRDIGLLVEDLHDDPVAVCRELGAVTYNPDHHRLLDRLVSSPDLVETLHAAGIAVMVYTADDPAHWTALVAAGVDGIITNRPAELVQFLQQKVA